MAMDIQNMKISATQSNNHLYVESHSRYIHSAIIVMITIIYWYFMFILLHSGSFDFIGRGKKQTIKNDRFEENWSN